MPNPARPKTILIVAGEPSGDRLGGALMAALKTQHPNLSFIGVGGEAMIGQGLKPAFPMADLSVMGLFEVIPAIPRALRRLRQLTALAHTENPDLVITIDIQDFATRLASRLRNAHPLSLVQTVPHIHYVAPKVWAWRQHRVHKLKTLYTHLLTILPFEEKFFTGAGIPTTYVGHPAVTMLAPYTRTPNTEYPKLALLPGSRTAELKRQWPLYLQTYRALRKQNPNLSAVLALPGQRALATCQALAPWNDADAITVALNESRFAHLATCTAALAKSGTNNLELAILGLPAVVTYRMNPLTYLIAKRMVKVPYISLPNLILHYAGKPAVYPEFIQHAATLQSLTGALQPLLRGTPAQQPLLQTLKTLLATPQPPAQLAAAIASKYL